MSGGAATFLCSLVPSLLYIWCFGCWHSSDLNVLAAAGTVDAATTATYMLGKDGKHASGVQPFLVSTEWNLVTCIYIYCIYIYIHEKNV